MNRKIFVILLAALNSGCAFVSIESNATRFINNPPLTIERAKLDCDKLENSATRSMTISNVTKQQLKDTWGKPDNIEIINNIERWTYKTDWRWNGLWGVFVVIPVPLVIPTGHESMIVEISNGLVQSAEVHYQLGRELGCGFVLIHGGGWYCANGEPNHYYGLHSSFCGYGNDFNQPGEN